MRLSIGTYFDQTKPTYYIINSLLLGCLIGILITQNNSFLLFGAFFLVVRLIIFTNPFTSFYIILFSVFFIDWIRDLGLISDQFTLLSDVLIFVLLIKLIIVKIKEKRWIRTPIDIPLILFILLGLISTFINGQHIFTTILGFRFDLKYTLMFYIIVNMNPDESFFRRMILFLIILLLIQVPVAMVKYTIYGQGEEAIGTYAYHTGILSTIIPLIAISLFLGFYFFKKGSILYIIAALSFFLFSIIGGKRGFLFIGIFLSFFLAYQAGLKNIIRSYILIPFLIIGFLGCLYLVPTFRPVFNDPSHILKFIVEYESLHDAGTDEAAGRTAAVVRTHEILKTDVKNIIFGFGPGSISKSFFKQYRGRFVDTIPIIYGRSQWVTMSLENGYLGTLLFMMTLLPFFKLNSKVFRNIDDPYWKSIFFGFKGICMTFIIGFFYGVIFRMDVSSFIFWFLAATVFCIGRQRKII